jgi:entericidin B
MTKTFATFTAIALMTVALSSCGNTIRGAGKDLAGTVDATQNAGKRVDNAAKY